MEQTFMTIHSTDPDAVILFVSDSVYDILGYTAQEVQGKSCFEFFHPEEVPFARSIHSRGVLLDKAAVLHYVRIQARDGQWVSCECCFTVVHDVLVACTSIYRRGEKSERRAIEAPQIRRLFSCSPRDPRYHMLEHLSPKFRMPPVEREPRAALILNRFTRTLTVMFATNAVSSILGVRPDQIKDKSFYECIQENCLPDAIRCLESAKANDSIAYLRFWYRDPRRPEDFEEEDDEHQSGNSSDSEGGGVQLDARMDVDEESPSPKIKQEDSGRPDLSTHSSASHTTTTMTSGSSSRQQQIAEDVVPEAEDSANRPSPPPESLGSRRRDPFPSFELEAVVSCTSDGLVVVLRKARPPIPAPHPPLVSPTYTNGLFAAPWGHHPIRPQMPQEMLYNFRPPLMPQYMPLQDNVMTIGGPPVDHLMNSIRDVAVFAWALVGINGNLATYTRGLPRGEAQPDGLPVWDASAGNVSYLGPENQAVRRWIDYDEKGKIGFPSSSSANTQPRSREPSSGYTHVPQMGSYAFSQPAPPTWPGLQPAYTSAYDQYSGHNQVPLRSSHHQSQHSRHHGHQQPQHQHQHQHQQQQQRHQEGSGMQAAHHDLTWGEVPPPYNGQGHPNNIPTTSAGPNEPSHSYRYPWQQ
ncbi:potassium voltage-dependent transporter [Colletotrichum musicola]|uniref:Potassium voltage-dependent transporter n=1 Tax=Colletotrichum musicola TaxID=2175873 RepID=A0A8H6NK04_9PEZI|nr:potassium voltage-dependent transporter [Colletotrichum musicola]